MFILAIPTAYLGYCFQQQGSYPQSVSSLRSQVVQTVNNAVNKQMKIISFYPQNAIMC